VAATSSVAVLSIDSPDGTAGAILYRSATDAISGYDYQLSLQSRATAEYPAPAGSFIWRSYGCAPELLIWLDELRVAIVVDEKNPRCVGAPSETVGTPLNPGFRLLVLEKVGVMGRIREAVSTEAVGQLGREQD
jgi:hypothetical protein